MGTSKSYGGPSDASKLLPAWALPSGDSDGAGGPAGSDGGSGTPESAPAGSTDDVGQSAGDPSPPPLQGNGLVARPWMGARRSFSSAIRGSGPGGARNYRRAARGYVRASGGARGAARTAVAGRAATARFAGFLSSIPTTGAVSAVRALGLASFTGKSVDELFATIANALAPDGATHDEAAARQAIVETLSQLYEDWGVEDGGLDRLQAMSADDVRAAVTESVSAYIFFRWALELGLAIERKAISAKEAVAIEGEMRQYIRDTLTLDLERTDVLTIDWAADDGRRIIDRVYQEAYSLIETST